MSRAFEASNEIRRQSSAPIALRPRLHALVEAAFVRSGAALLLSPLARQATGPEAFPDPTGYEAFVNKMHVEDLLDEEATTDDPRGLQQLILQGISAAVRLAERLEGEGRYRVLASLDVELPTLTLRFFGRRAGQPWGPEDPADASVEELLIIDTEPAG